MREDQSMLHYSTLLLATMCLLSAAFDPADQDLLLTQGCKTYLDLLEEGTQL